MRRYVARGPTRLLAVTILLASSGAAAQQPSERPTRAGSIPPEERSTHELLRSGAIALESRSFLRAGARFREAVAIDPHLAQAHLGVGLAALGDGDRRGAERSLRRATELAPDLPEAHYAIGVTRLMFGNPRRGEEDLEAALRADRFFLEARYAIGVAAARRGDLEAAKASLREAIRMTPRHAASHYQLGAVLAWSGDLVGGMRELSRGVTAAPTLLNARPDDPLLFVDRLVSPERPARGAVDMPLPVPRPIIAREDRRSSTLSRDNPAIPGWYLYYDMALQLEDAGEWYSTVALLKRAIAIKEKSESLAIVANRLVDYSPHFHMATAYHRLGEYRDAYLHLGVAKNEGNASPEAMQALSVLIKKDRLRPRIILQPLPDKTTEGSIRIRGVVIAEEPARRVEVSGREAVLTRPSAAELQEFLTQAGQAAPRGADTSILFEIGQFQLGAGPNHLIIQPFFRNIARDGDVLEVRVVRIAAPADPK